MNRKEFKKRLIEWSQLLCEEEASDEKASVKNIYAIIDKIEAISSSLGKKCEIKYRLKNGYGRIEYNMVGDVISGAIDFEIWKTGDFIIFETFQITKGYGPLLYEILIEKATEAKVCLMSDRGEVSDSARAVWDKYLSRDDIKYKQIDGDVESSLSKCYRKDGPLVILDRLSRSKFIDFIEVRR